MNQIDAPKSRLFRVGPHESLVTLGIAAGIFGLWMIQFENLDIIALTIVVVFFLMGIPLQAGFAIYLLIATVLILKFVLAPHNSIQLASVGWIDLLYALVVMTFAGLCFRYLELSKYIRTYYPAAGKSRADHQKTKYRFPSLLGGRWWLIPIAVMAATVLLEVIPHDTSSTRRYWITPTGTRLIFLTFFLFFFWFVCRSVLGFAMRWRMEPEQADVQVRSMIANEFWNEQIPIEARRLKYRIRNRRT